MAQYRTFSSAGGDVIVEVTDTGAAGVNTSDLASMVDPIGALAEAVAQEMRTLPKEGAPDRAEVSFGIKALESGGTAIALGSDANLLVTLSWGSGGGGVEDLMSMVPH